VLELNRKIAERELRLGEALPRERRRAIRRRLELEHCKWDAQVGDRTALLGASLLLRRAAWEELAQLSECLFAETLALEQELLERPELHGELGVPRRLRALLRGKLSPSAGRVMRFDFHPTPDGWRVSEVNSDVPGGYAEATHLSRLMAAEGPVGSAAGDPTAAVVAALRAAAQGAPVGFVCAPGYMEDQQVVSQLAQAFGAESELLSLDQLTWVGGRARVDGRELGAIFRFFQAEWLATSAGAWPPLFGGGSTPVANPAPAVLSESKRLPLVWDRVKTPLPTWRQLLPETRELRAAPWATDDGWLLKSAYCNNGDTVSIRSALAASEWRKRSWRARLAPRGWLAQRRFEVLPLTDDEGALYPCIGVYVVNGAAAGVYARVTRGAVIDFAAADAALLID
jgi:glutathionylspermidine synthase